MAGKGPPPKDAAKRQRRNATLPQTELRAAERLAGPELPAPESYRRETLAWYESWRRSPQASQFTGPDWERLHLLAELVDALFDRETTITTRIKVMTEIRHHEAKLGATPLDRQTLRWKLAAPADEATPGSAPASARSSRRRPDPRIAAAPKPSARKRAKKT